jgi:hypothetical protein
VRSIAGRAFKSRDECDRSLKSRPNTRNCSRIPTAQGWKQWRLGSARATARDAGLRGVRSILPLAFNHSALDRTILRLTAVRSIALTGTPNFSSSQFRPLLPCIECNGLHHKTLKQHKTLVNNKTKSLTNIS